MKTTKINNSDRVKKLTGVAILIAIEIVLQTIGNFLSLTGVAINLALIPIAIGAILYGPLAGALLGFINGLVILYAPSTEGFMAFSIWGTIITCLSKCTIAGLVAGFVYRLIEKKSSLVGSIVASLLIPFINTIIFVIFYVTVFKNMEGGPGDLTFIKILFGSFIALNFILEFSITTVLSPTIAKIIKIVRKDEE